MDVAWTSLLRHNVETLDISNGIFAVQWAENESQLHDNVIYCTCLNSAFSTIPNILTFNTAAWPVTIRAWAHDDSIIDTVRAVGSGWGCSQSLRCIDLIVFVIQVLLKSDLVPDLNSIKQKGTMDVSGPDARDVMSVPAVLDMFKKLPNCGTEIWNFKKNSSFIDGHSKRRFICDMEGSGGSHESAMWFRGIGNKTTRNGISEDKVVDDRM